jgi:acetyl esterase/lipase
MNNSYLAAVLVMMMVTSSFAQQTQPQGQQAQRGPSTRPLLPEGARALRDLVYVTRGAQNLEIKLDIFLPPGNGAKPLMIWIHGGACLGGSKASNPMLFLVENGFAVASIDYRLSGEAKFPAQIHDVKAALRFLRTNAHKYQIDPDRIAVGGDSAGGHLAVLLGVSAGVRELTDQPQSDVSDRVQAVVDLYGPTDLLAMCFNSGAVDHAAPDAPESQLIGAHMLDRPDLAKAASPTTYIDAGDPPFLILHGDRDTTVPFSQSRLLDSYLKLAGVKSTLVPVEGAGHGGRDFSTPRIRQKIVAFLQEALRVRGSG